MSNHLAIATVTATLRNLLQSAVNADVTGAQVTTVPPHDSTNLPGVGANLYLYQVVPNAAWRNADLPTRSRVGHTVRRPTIALDLHYLLTFYGSEGTQEPQRALGSVLRAMQARPVLTGELIQATLDAAEAEDPDHYLLASDLVEEVERVKFTPMPLNLEEVSKLWSVLLQTPYTLSMAYQGTVVLIEAEDTPRRSLPVRERVVGARPFQRARIDRIEREAGGREPIEIGDTVVLRGTQLAGEIERIRVGPADDLTPVPDSVMPSQLRLVLAGPGLRAGVVGVQIVYESGATSNTAPLVLRPRIVTDAGGAYRLDHDPGPDTLEVVLDPPVEPAQRVELSLNEFRPASGPGRAYRFEALARSSATDTVTFPVGEADPGRYLVRVEVGGAETTLDLEPDETSPDFGFYVAPAVDLP